MDAVIGREVGRRLCDIFGLQADRVTRLVLTLDVTGLALLEVTLMVGRDDQALLEELLTAYHLVPWEGDAPDGRL